MLTQNKLLIKRFLDILISSLGLLVLFIPICILIIISSLSCKSLGLYMQTRVGQHAKLFTIYKIKTMRTIKLPKESKLLDFDKYGITIKDDKRITSFGNFLRKSKLDELPQLLNVFIGTMSIVGPRPDVVGYADKLQGNDRIILTIKPGITGPATLAYKNEEQLLIKSKNPIAYNKEVIWPEKVKLNIKYIQSWSLKKDIYYMFKTIFN